MEIGEKGRENGRLVMDEQDTGSWYLLKVQEYGEKYPTLFVRRVRRSTAHKDWGLE